MDKKFQKIANADLGRIAPEDYSKVQKIPVVVVLDNVRSLNNIGSVFRTADAFAIEAIYLCGFTAKPPHRDIQKTALGATETVSWHYFSQIQDAIKQLREEDYIIASVEQTEKATPLHQVKVEKPIAIVLGNEVQGVSQEVCSISDLCIEIPQFGTKHSLNIAVCAGAVLWELCRQFRLTNS